MPQSQYGSTVHGAGCGRASRMNEMSVPQRRRHVRTAPHLRVPFGHRLDDGTPVVWDSRQAINGHMLISGPSGTGKTFQLNRLIATLAQGGASRIHVLNVHGDLCDGMPEDQVHTVRFSEQSPYGLQPLELLDDPDLGGVRRRALAFIALMALQGALGQRQRPALFRLLVEGYRRFGFYADVPTTWGLDHDPRDQPGAAKRFPTLRDLKDSVWRRLVMMKMGQTQTTTAALEKVVTLAKRRAQLRKRPEDGRRRGARQARSRSRQGPLGGERDVHRVLWSRSIPARSWKGSSCGTTPKACSRCSTGWRAWTTRASSAASHPLFRAGRRCTTTTSRPWTWRSSSCS